MIGGPFKYLEHARKVHGKFSRGLKKDGSLQKVNFFKLKMRLEYSEKMSFLRWNFFFKSLLNLNAYKHFQGESLQTYSRYLEGLPNFAFTSSKKSWPHDTPVRLYVQEWKNFARLRWSSSNGIRILGEKLIFEVKLLFWSL